MQIGLLIFLAITSYGWCFNFEDPEENGVEFDGSSVPATVLYNENNEGGRITLVTVSEVSGSLQLQILGTAPGLDAIANNNGTYWSITANLLDYEKYDDPNFNLIVKDDSDEQFLNIKVVNLDDESPTLSTAACNMDEETFIDTDNSICTFQITDPDGWLSFMNFEAIIGSKNEDSLFELKYKEIPDNSSRESDVFLVLKDGQKLDFETTAIYSFHIAAKDNAGHLTIPVASVPVIVQVNDMPDQPPVWQTLLTAKTILEKQETTIQVLAKDGDIGIDNDIKYNISSIEFAEINADGLITVKPINRDNGYDQVLLTVTAIEVQEPNSTSEATILLIIEDVDDSIPEIKFPNFPEKSIIIKIDEGSSEITTNVTINVTDKDLGENAMYNATLTAENEEFLTAFAIIPGKGYQTTLLALTITDPKKLDFENPPWQNISLTLHTQGIKTSTNYDEGFITILLNDINDESPTFEAEYNAIVYENITSNQFITFIRAVDLDAEDKNCKHSILGALGNRILEIEAFGGNVTTKIKDAFDYEKQTEVIVQIIATDNAAHTGTTQLTITVLDVNDESPKLTVISSINVEENQSDGTVLDTNISAFDEDTTADLEFTIDWKNSYATKNSRKLKDEDFVNYHCIKIETEPGVNNNAASAKLSIIETQSENTPDYEVFDTLYINVLVIDKNTEMGSNNASTTIVINIQDINDNPPIFEETTQRREVTENSREGTVVTRVTATDRDITDNVTYSMEPTNGDTPNWLEIDPETGSISVHLVDNDTIDCDFPNPLYNLNYTVTARDGIHTTLTNILINITDQNTKYPELTVEPISINEDNGLDPKSTQDGKIIITLNPRDDDRDEPFHTVVCSFSSLTPVDVTNRFKVNNNNEILVSLSNGATLDREVIPSFEFDLNCYDDPTHQGPTSLSPKEIPRVKITLIDVNDNIPTIIPNLHLDAISENLSEGDEVPSKIEGYDPDEGSNGLISFAIVKVERSKTSDHQNPEDITDHFEITDAEDGKSATLRVVKDLRKNWGFLVFTIKTTDKGNEPLSKENTIELQVLRYNFLPPKFIFPLTGKTYYLKPDQSANSQLILYDGNNLPKIEATDQQDDKYKIQFSILEDSSGTNLFKISTLTDTFGELQFSTSIYQRLSYNLILGAAVVHDDSQIGEAPYSVNCTINIGFFDYNSTEPVFENHIDTASFVENYLNQSYQIQEAIYPDITSIPLNSYYFLRNGNETIFQVDVGTGNVTLLTPLDFETEQTYNLTIQASHTQDGYNPAASDDTRLVLTVNVVDVNDNPPVFDQPNYFGTLLSLGAKTVLSVHATDIDTTSKTLIYSIKSVTASSNTLDSSKDAFVIDPNSGEISRNFDVKENMEGFFTLEVVVEDEAPENHNDTTIVRLYVVTTKNTVQFNFGNDINTVNSKEADIKNVLKSRFTYETYVERTTTDSNTTDNSPRTTVSVYFIDTKSNVPVEAVNIYRNVTNVDSFTRLKNEFLTVGLLLLSFNSETETENLEAMLKAWLIGVSVVLGAFCLILLIAFILKTRSLNQRIKKLSSTEFGSQESGLNRQGIAAPTTNKHAVEGSNPVYEVDTKEIDRQSVTSGDSDLIGVEDDEKFNYEEPYEYKKDIQD